MTAMERIAALKQKNAAGSGAGAAVSSQPSAQSSTMQRIQALKAKAQAQEQQGQNAAFTHSGLSRDAFDSGVRANYGKSHPDSSYANVVRGANTLNVQNTALTDLESRYGLENDVTKKTRIAQQYNDKLDAVKKRYQQYQLDLAGYQLLQQDAQNNAPTAPVTVDRSAIGNQGLYTGGLVLPVESAAQATRSAAQSAMQQSAAKLYGYDSLYSKYQGKKLNSAERNEVFSAMQQLSDTMNNATATTQDRALARGEWEKLRNLDLYSNYLTYPVGKFATGFTQGVAPVAGGILQTVGDVAGAVTGNENTGSKGIAKLERYFQSNPGEAPNINNANDGHYISRIATATGVDTATVQSYLENERGAFTRDFSENTLGQTLNPKYKKVVGTVAEQIGQQIPGILLTSGAVAGEGAGGLVSKLMNGEGLKNAMKAALGGNPATVLLGSSAYSQQLHNLARENKVGVGAYADSLGTGFVEYFTEGLFGFSDANSYKAIFSGATGNTLKTVLKDFGKLMLGSGEEGLEEVVGDPMERALDKATVDHSIPMFGKGGVIDPQQMLSDGVTAATTALVMGGFASVSGMYSSYRESLDIQQAGEQLNHIIDQYNAASGASIPNVNPKIMTQEQMDTKAAEVISGWADYANRAHTQALAGDTAQTVPQAAQTQGRETTPENAQTSDIGEFNREGAKKIGSNITPERNSTRATPAAANADVVMGQSQTAETSNGTVSTDTGILKDILNGERRVQQSALTDQEFDRAAVSGAAIDAKGNVYIPNSAEHIDNRTNESVSPVKVKAFQFDHPELHRYFQQAAKDLLLDAQASIDTPVSRRTEYTMQGKRTIRQIAETPQLRSAMNDAGLTRAQIMDAAQLLIDDHGQENVAAAKRLELVLDDMLANGYTTVYGSTVEPNEKYIQAKSEIAGSNPAQHESVIPDELDAVPEDKNSATTSGSGNRGETVQVVVNLRNSIPSLSEMAPVASVTSNTYQSAMGTTMAEKARSLFESIKGIVNRPGFGDVEINNRSVKDDLSHGVGPAKASVIQAIPEVIANGKQIDFQEKWKGRPYDGYVFAAPVEMDGETAYIAAVVKRTSKNRFYLHEVVDSEGNIIKTDNGDRANQTSLAANGDAGTQSLLSTDNVAQSDEKINGKNVDTPGDAPKGFDPLSRMQGEKNATQMHSVNEQAAERTQEERRRAPSDIPKENLEGLLTSKHAATLANTPVTTNEMSAAIERELANGNFSRMAYTDEAAQKKTDAHIRRVGWDAALAEYKVAVKDGKSSKDIVSLGQTLYNNFVNSGDVMGAMDIAALMISNAKETAQALQAMNMINKATPESRLYMVAQSVENMQQKLEEKYGDRAPDLKIDKDLLKNYYDALKTTDKAAQTDAWHAVEQNIADQIPATWKDKLNAWRYLAMLGNPRTHIRNIAGNAGFMPVRMIKDAVAAGIENAANIEGRTKAILNPVNTSDRSLLQFGWSDYDGVVDQIQSGGKFVDTSGEIENMRTIFGIKPLESTRKFNTFALDLEDTWFSRPAYAGALAGWMKANGFSTQDILNGTITDSKLSEARSYAIKEAQKATYRDSNDFSDAVARMGRNYTGNSKTGKVANVLLEGVLPFKRTPANILVRGVEYSPVGLVKGIYDMTTKVKGGEVSAAQAIDEFSSGLTGTGLLALGMLLAKLGLASGSADDDKDKENFEKLRGGQDYALTIGNKSFTIDWLAPEALPFFMGIEVHKFLADSDGYTPHEAMESLKNLSEPILETSMLSSLEDILSNIKYADGDYLGTIASTAVTSYLSQFLPTLAGQAERSFTEKNRMETFRYGDTDTLGTGGAYGLGQALNKVPGVDYGQIPYIDAWGRTQDQGGIVGRVLNNFLNPSYVSGDRSESVDQELQRLYDAGNAGVLPERGAQSTKIDGSYLSQGEYVKYNQTKGKTALDLVSDFIGGNAYKGLTDKERAAVIRDIYTYAGDRAKKAVVQSRGETYESEWDDESGLKDLPDYLAVKDTFSAASKARDYQTIDGLSHKYSALSDKAKTVLDNSFGRLDQIAEAHDSGIDSEQWYAAYDMWKDLYDTKRSGYSAMDKATDFAAWVDKTGLSAQQRDLLKGQLAFSSGYKVSADKYEAFTKAGLTTDTAVNVYDTISSLTPAAGKSTVSSKQKFAAISNMDNLSDGQKLLAMFGLDTDSDSTYEKYNAASEAGIPLSGWAEFTSKLDSSVSQGDLQTAINTMPWSRAQKAAAWRVYSDAKHWKAANPWG